MNKKIKAKWIKALKSGAYHQAKGDLKVVEYGHARYCCLGVLTQLYCKETGRKFEDVAGNTSVLPNIVKTWAGLGLCDPTLKLTRDQKRQKAKYEDCSVNEVEDTTSCSQLNDEDDSTFKEIANAIQRSL